MAEVISFSDARADRIFEKILQRMKERWGISPQDSPARMAAAKELRRLIGEAMKYAE